MAEAAKKEEHLGPHEGPVEHAEGAAHNGGGDDPMHHILDSVIFGMDANTGQIIRPYDAHGHLRQECATYVPRTIGPVKLEFTRHMLGLTVVAVIFFALAMTVARRVLKGLHENTAPKGPLANAVEAIIVFVRDEMVEPIGGHHLGHYTPLFINYFLFILTANLIGMIPYFGFGVTGNFGVTLALGGSIYALVWILGISNQGFGYLAHLVPPGTPFWMWPLMFVLELMGPLIKCFVLCVRLFANMIAGHLIIGTVLGLGAFGGAFPVGLTVMMLGLGVPLALGISMLEVMVCFIQAYVFTLLAVIFIGGAVHPEH